MELIGPDVDDEDQSVVVLDLFHSRLGGQRMLDDVVGIHVVPRWRRLTWVFWVAHRSEGSWPGELDRGPDLLDPGAELALGHLLLGLLSLLNLANRRLLGGSLIARLLVGGALGHRLGAGSLGLR